MATQKMRVALAQDSGDRSRPPSHVPGQLIVRLKPGAVRQVAASPLRAMTARAAAAAMPEEVQGPIDLLRNEVGLLSMKPLFVVEGDEAPAQLEGRALATVHRSLSRSAIQTPRESLAGFQIVRVKDKRISAALLKRLRASKAVDFVEPVPNRWLCAADPMINRQWGLRAIRWFAGRHPDAKTVHVAVLDSGIDDGHPDLAASIEEYRHDGNMAQDFLGHGTHVGGTIAAVVNNSVGIAGVANCRLHCWKVFDDPTRADAEPEFNLEFYSTALAALLDSEVKVVNLSIGGDEYSRTESIAIRELIKDGVVVATAMGNEKRKGNPIEYPAGYRNTIGVGAVDEVNRHSTFSNTGRHIGLVAPGENILSTVPRIKAQLADHRNYDSWPGTSMATPHVAGAAALVYAHTKKSKAAGLAVAERLVATAQKLPDMKGKKFTQAFGSGLLDLAAALGQKPKRAGRKAAAKRAKSKRKQ
jgi:subtilisin family serine protease